MNDRQKTLHAILMLYPQGLKKQEIANMLKLNLKQVVDLSDELQESLSDSGVELISTNDNLKIVVNSKFLPKNLPKAKVEVETLSASATEVLTIIAYQQPIGSAKVEQIRGVNSDQSIRGLLEKELIGEQKLKKGGIYYTTFVTTEKFLELCGINNLSQLPKL